ICSIMVHLEKKGIPMSFTKKEAKVELIPRTILSTIMGWDSFQFLISLLNGSIKSVVLCGASWAQ
ncbi:hypothetical protein PJP07_31360, partial [Mycobacterium kansasii]